MVYFTCNNCGASLKKNAVETHYRGRCRNPIALTCVDCLKDFFGQDYVVHTTCITEAEKYSGKGFKSRPPSKKGEVKQLAWVEVVDYVKNSAENMSTMQMEFLHTISKHPNIPQKKSKFQNFAKNVWYSASRQPDVVNYVWDKLETEFLARKQENSKSVLNLNEDSNEPDKCVPDSVDDTVANDVEETQQLSKKEKKSKRKRDKYESELEDAKKFVAKVEDTNIENETDVTNKDTLKMSKKEKKKLKSVDEEGSEIKSKKKRKHDIDADMCTAEIPKKKKKNQESINKNDTPNEKVKISTCSEEEVTASKFDWACIIMKVLESADGKELRVKRLMKKVLSEYEACGMGEADVKVLAKFNKKLNKTPGVVVLKDRAKLKC